MLTRRGSSARRPRRRRRSRAAPSRLATLALFPTRRPNEWCSARPGRPGHPRPSAAAGLRAREPDVLLGLVLRQLGHTVRARADRAHRADRDRRRHRIRASRSAARSSPTPDWFETPFTASSAFLYTIPSLALFELLVPITGLNRDHRRDRAGLLHAADPVPQHPHRAREVPADALEAARAMGLTGGRS